jgi:hypothetical protein
VTITGLSLHGGGTGNDGILIQAVGFLRLYSVLIENFANDGVQFNATSGNLAIYDSKINDCGHDGLLLQASGARAYVHNTDFDNNAFAGANSAEGHLTIADSSSHYNARGFFADGGVVELYGDRVIYNVQGLVSSATAGPNGAGTLYFADCLIANNGTSYAIGSGGVMGGSSPGTSLITPGQGTPTGTLSPQTLQ